ncbi:unnamed protein product, partial [Chrysoparadoxa australica]
MKHLLTCFLLIYMSLAFGQETVEQYVREGIGYHDAGDFQSAIEAYQHALYLNPNSSLANYEIAMTFSAMNAHDSAMKYTNKVLELDDGSLLPAYIIKGNTLDATGHPDEALEVYETALKNIGENYLLHYNMGLTQYKVKRYADAQNSLITAILINSGHTSSHLILGNLMQELN